MRINLLTSVLLENRWRSSVVLFTLLFLILLVITPGKAQLKDQKRITSLQVAEAAEGSRVTIVSDSALSDYEAFKRGDRFYVKIPLADFTAAEPHFQGNGFDDVHVQKVGDSVLVSFKLQVGATARVDQRSNRLEVIFSAPYRTTRSKSQSAAFNRVTSGVAVGVDRAATPQITQGRQSDTAGPIPPGSPQAYRERTVTERPREFRATEDQGAQIPVRNDSNKIGNSRSAKETAAAKSEARSKALPSPTSPAHPALASGTPAPSFRSSPGVSSPGLAGPQSWQGRSKTALKWISANRPAAVLGALILLSLIGFFGTNLYRRRKGLVKTKRVKAPGVQPKYVPGVELSDVFGAAPISGEPSSTPSSDVVSEYTTPHSQSEVTTGAVSIIPSQEAEANRIQEKPGPSGLTPEPKIAGSLGVPYAWIPASPPPDSLKPGLTESGRAEEEREVFEL